MITNALNHGMGAGIADREPFPDHAAQENLPCRGAEQNHVAADDVFLGNVVGRRVVRRPHHDPAAGESLADVVVGVAVHPQGNALGHKRAEAVAGGAVEGDVDRSVRQALATIGFRQLVTEHGAHRAVDVADGGGKPNRFAGIQRLAAHHDQLLIQRLVQAMILTGAAVQVLVHERGLRLVQNRSQVQLVRLPVSARQRGVQRTHLADGLVEGAEAQLRQVLPDFFGDEHEEVLDELGLAGEALPQHRVLGSHADRAGVEVTYPHHDATHHHQRRGSEAELLSTQQRTDHHVASGLELPVHLDHDPVA